MIAAVSRLVVGVGSARAPKIEAVRRALERVAPLAPALGAAEVVARDVGAVAPAMPLSVDVLLEGCRARAGRVLELLGDEGPAPDLAVGLEGGFDVRERNGRRTAFLMSWAYVTDGRFGAHGCGGALELPVAILEAVVDRGVELSDAIDRFAEESDVRSRQGAWGVFTRGIVERSDSFVVALVSALAPFYNARHYPRP